MTASPRHRLTAVLIGMALVVAGCGRDDALTGDGVAAGVDPTDELTPADGTEAR